MGLIKAVLNAARTTLADEWLEYIYCDALPANVLMRKGQKRMGKGTSNTKGSDNIITRGSHIAVNEGQFLLVVDDGKVVDFTDDAGVYTFDQSTEPSLFYGGFGKGLLASFERVGKRITFGGDTGHDQRAYFINKKLIPDNKFGTRAPVPFRDGEWGLTINIRCFGTYVYRVTDPLLFYTNLCGNAAYEYRSDEFAEQFRSDLIGALQTALGRVAEQRIAYDRLTVETDAMTQAVRAVLKADWEDKAGVNVDRVVIESVTPTDDDARKIQKLQETRVYGDGNFAQAAMRRAQAGMVDNMGVGMAKGGGSNAAGDAVGMMGMAMAGGMMGLGNPFANLSGSAQGTAAAQWKCACGAVNTGKFCTECGGPKPGAEPASTAPGTWVCACGAENTGKFCTECGKPKPVLQRYRCSKCGWLPPDPSNPPKFCPECGDRFGDEDRDQGGNP